MYTIADAGEGRRGRVELGGDSSWKIKFRRSSCRTLARTRVSQLAAGAPQKTMIYEFCRVPVRPCGPTWDWAKQSSIPVRVFVRTHLVLGKTK